MKKRKIFEDWMEKNTVFAKKGERRVCLSLFMKTVRN